MSEHFTIAFYNLENFFDTENDPATNDDAFTPKGIMHWVNKRYFNKVQKIAFTISQIGKKESGTAPAVIGLAEVENKQVLHDLIQSKALRKNAYKFVHFESNDRRGMDVALLYRSDIFSLAESQAYPLTLHNDSGEAYQTRDILYVRLTQSETSFHFIVNHWPSRKEGDIRSDVKRKQAALQLREIIDYVLYEASPAQLFVMGDFNTNPDDVFLSKWVVSNKFLNPFINLYRQGLGSLRFKKRTMLFDQIFYYGDLKEVYTFQDAGIFSPYFLSVWKGKYKGWPFRTYLGLKYQGGYSDHFPVYIIIKKGKQKG